MRAADTLINNVECPYYTHPLYSFIYGSPGTVGPQVTMVIARKTVECNFMNQPNGAYWGIL